MTPDETADPGVAVLARPPQQRRHDTRNGADPRFVALAAMDHSDPARATLRQTIVEAHLPLVHHLAQRFRGRGEPYDDLVQVGTIGLLHAVDRFDPDRGSFTGFAASDSCERSS